MFEFKDQLEDLRVLWKAMDEMDSPQPCENYPDAFFPDYTEPGSISMARDAISLCDECPVKALCGAYGMRWEEDGIYGGTTARERKDMRSKLRRQGYDVPFV